MASLRVAANDYLGAWRRGDRGGRLLLAAGAVVAAFLVGAFLVGAFLFGAWHVVVGGLVEGNPRAAAFGIALSAVTAVLLAILRAVARRTALRRPPAV